MSSFVSSYESAGGFEAFAKSLFGTESMPLVTVTNNATLKRPHPAEFLQHFAPRPASQANVANFVVRNVPRNYTAFKRMFLFSFYAEAEMRRANLTLAAVMERELASYSYARKENITVRQSRPLVTMLDLYAINFCRPRTFKNLISGAIGRT